MKSQTQRRKKQLEKTEETARKSLPAEESRKVIYTLPCRIFTYWRKVIYTLHCRIFTVVKSMLHGTIVSVQFSDECIANRKGTESCSIWSSICAIEREIHNQIIDGIEKYELEIHVSLQTNVCKIQISDGI